MSDAALRQTLSKYRRAVFPVIEELCIKLIVIEVCEMLSRKSVAERILKRSGVPVSNSKRDD